MNKDQPQQTDTDKIIQTVRQFCIELRITFPEFSTYLNEWADLDENDIQWTEQLVPHILEIYPPHFFDIMFKSDILFQPSSAPLFLLPGLDFKLLMNVDNITPEIQNTIWDYLHAILFLTIPLVKDKSQFRDAAHLFDSVPDEELSERIYNAFKNCNPLTDSNNENTADGDDTADGSNEKAAESAEKMKGLLERIMGSKLGRLSKTLMDELRPEMESMFPDLNMQDDTSQTDVFKILMKNPTKMISLIKKAKERMESKINSGEISRDELMEDMTEMMKDADLKKEMEAMMKHMGGKGKMNPNAMRSEMSKHTQRNRMRQKREQKQQKTFFKESTDNVPEMKEDEVFRVDTDTKGRQTTKIPQTEEEIAAIIAELECSMKTDDANKLFKKQNKTKQNKK